MTDPKVLIFGSFTEDEIKSLQCQVVQNHVEITFGSLDSATLRSVGICNAKQAEFGYFKGSQPSKNIEKRNAKTISTADSRSHVIVTTTDNNQSIHSLHTGCNSHDIQELKTSNEPSASYVTESICNSRNCSSAGLHCLEDLSISSEPSVKEDLTSSSKGVGISNSMGSFYKASNGPVATERNILPRGLVNLGNLCFLNSTLQALLSCSSFVQLLLDLRSRDIQKIEYPTLHAFVEFISDFDVPVDSNSKRKDTVLETGRPFRPLMFESILKIFTPDVLNSLSGRPRQEDAQEFLSFLMHQMHDELLKFEGRIPNGNEGRVGLISAMNDEDDEDNWETVGPRNKTAITRAHSFISSKLSAIFGGQLKSVVKARGNKASATIQPFLLLHLNVCPEPVCTIEDALRLFSAPETLEGYRASAAGKVEVVSASKSIKILELPEIMILHLMRFSYGSLGSTKLNKPVRFPLDLVLGRELLVSPSSEGRRYELVATITHHGREPSKGHYTADARRANGKWMHYDDASVTAISPSKVLHDQAYVLFYKQV